MKSVLERRVATIVDLQEQIDSNPNASKVLFVEDGAVNRAFLVDSVSIVNVESRLPRVIGYLNANTVIQFPAHMGWRCVDRSVLEMVSGEDLEKKDLQDNIARAEYRYKLAKEYKKSKGDKKEDEQGEQLELGLDSSMPEVEVREIKGKDYYGTYL